MAIFTEGTASVDNGSTTVTGTGTAWSTQVKRGGKIFIGEHVGVIASDPESSDSGDHPQDDEIELAAPWPGPTVTDEPYVITAFRGGAEVGERVAELIRDFLGHGRAGVTDGEPEAGTGRDGDIAVDPNGRSIYVRDGGVHEGIEGIVTEEAGDARYGQLSGATFTGTVEFTGGDGAHGLGAVTAPDPPNDDLDDINSTSFHHSHDSANSPKPGSRVGVSIRRFSGRLAQFILPASDSASSSFNDVYHRGSGVGNWGEWYRFWTTANAESDSNGFLVEASPILKVHADHMEMNTTAARDGISEADYERIGLGRYRIVTPRGLAEIGWQVKSPEDPNGNKLVHVVVEDDDGTITVTTSEPVWHEGRLVAGDPVDIPEGRWVDVRLQERPPAPEELEGLPLDEDETDHIETVGAWHVEREKWRRICALVGASDQEQAREAVLRGTREATRLLNQQVRKGGLTEAEDARAAELESLDADILAIEDAAAVLTAMDPVPEDYAEDHHWP